MNKDILRAGYFTGQGITYSYTDCNIVPICSSINHLSNKDYYISNDYSNDLKLFKTWQYDGFTKVLTAKIKVIPNQKYHIKLAIADYGDPYYDSAIFIDAFGIRTKKAL